MKMSDVESERRFDDCMSSLSRQTFFYVINPNLRMMTLSRHYVLFISLIFIPKCFASQIQIYTTMDLSNKTELQLHLLT